MKEKFLNSSFPVKEAQQTQSAGQQAYKTEDLTKGDLQQQAWLPNY